MKKASSDQDWWNGLDVFGKEWRVELAAGVGVKDTLDLTDAKLRALLASTSITLYVYKGGVLDLEPLTRFPKLRELDITGFKKLENTKVLTKLSSLKKLTLRNDGLIDIGFLKNLVGLEQLDLMQNKLTGITVLGSLVKLETLDVGYNKLTTIDTLKKLTKLRTLSIAYNKIADLKALAELKSLVELKANDNRYTDLTPLAKLTELASLDVSGPFAAGKIKTLEPLRDLIKLAFLDISCNPKLTDLAPLAGCASLETLNCTVISESIRGFQDLLEIKALAKIVTHRDIMKKPDRDVFKKRRPRVELVIH